MLELQSTIEPDRPRALTAHEKEALKGAADSLRHLDAKRRAGPKSDFGDLVLRKRDNQLSVQIRPIADIAVSGSFEELIARMDSAPPADEVARDPGLVTGYDFTGYPAILLVPNIEEAMKGRFVHDVRPGVFEGQNLEFDLSRVTRPDGLVISETSSLASVSPDQIQPGKNLVIPSFDNKLSMVLHGEPDGSFSVSFKGDISLEDADVWFAVTHMQGEVLEGARDDGGRAQGVVELCASETGKSVMGEFDRKIKISADSKIAFVVD